MNTGKFHTTFIGRTSETDNYSTKLVYTFTWEYPTVVISMWLGREIEKFILRNMFSEKKNSLSQIFWENCLIEANRKFPSGLLQIDGVRHSEDFIIH